MKDKRRRIRERRDLIDVPLRLPLPLLAQLGEISTASGEPVDTVMRVVLAIAIRQMKREAPVPSTGDRGR